MATIRRQLYHERDLGSEIRIRPTHTRVRIFGADAGATVVDTKVEDNANGDLWPQGTPLYRSGVDGFWYVWTNGQSIDGILIGASGHGTAEAYTSGVSGEVAGSGRLQLSTAGEVYGIVMLNGDIHRDDVYLPPGETQNNLDAALASNVREDGINVYGLDAFH